jgi:hypothetical protein
LQQTYPGAQVLVTAGQIDRIYGAPLTRGATPSIAADAFIQEFAAELYNVAADDLVLYGTQDVMLGKFTAVYYVQQHAGLPVHGGGLTALTRADADNAVVLVSGEVFPLAGVAVPQAAISAEDAVAAAAKEHPDFAFRAATQVVLVRDIDGDRQREALPAYRFFGGNADPVAPQKFQFLVDARNGAVVERESQIDFEDITGSVDGMGSPGWRPDRADNPPTALPLQDLRVRVVTGNTADTAADGTFVVPHAGIDPVTVETSLSGSGATQAGRWARIINAGTGGTLSASQSVTPPGPVDFLLNPTPSEMLTAQVNAFIHTIAIHNFALGINPAYPGLDIQMAVNVNLNSSCNAFYDRDALSINFYRAGGGCPNMAYSSVVYHEYGHHIVNRAYTAAGRQQPGSQYHEGYSDTTSYMCMDDPCLGYGFFGGNACLRNGVNNWQHPCSGGGHDCGGVISGSFWDTRVALGVTEPGIALETVRDLYLNSILLVPAGVTPGITIDVLTLDDDDDTITNGTPHYEEIAAGFGAHNLDAPPLIDLQLSLGEPVPTVVSPAGGTRFGVVATPVASSANPAECFLHYSVDGGAFVAVPLQAESASDFDAVFPAIACRADVRFYVSVTSQRGNVFRLPANAPTTTYSASSGFWIGETFSDNFQTDQGWTVVDSDTLVFGSWERGTPAGSPISGVPPADYDGSGMAYVTGAINGRNVDDGWTALTSPVFAFLGDAPTIRYAVWFNNSTGLNPGQDLLVISISNDDGQSWTPLETLGPSGPGSTGGWNVRTVDVATVLPVTNQVRLQFVASDTGGPSTVEAAIDAVRVRDFACVPNDTPGDMDCDGSINFLDIDPFVLALFDPAAYAAGYPACRLLNADVSGDGLVNFLDIDPFVDLLFP